MSPNMTEAQAKEMFGKDLLINKNAFFVSRNGITFIIPNNYPVEIRYDGFPYNPLAFKETIGSITESLVIDWCGKPSFLLGQALPMKNDQLHFQLSTMPRHIMVAVKWEHPSLGASYSYATRTIGAPYFKKVTNPDGTSGTDYWIINMPINRSEKAIPTTSWDEESAEEQREQAIAKKAAEGRKLHQPGLDNIQKELAQLKEVYPRYQIDQLVFDDLVFWFGTRKLEYNQSSLNLIKDQIIEMKKTIEAIEANEMQRAMFKRLIRLHDTHLRKLGWRPTFGSDSFLCAGTSFRYSPEGMMEFLEMLDSHLQKKINP